MKIFALIMAILATTGSLTVARADGGNESDNNSTPMESRTIVGGCADARVVQSGENSEIVYTGPCHVQAGAPLVVSDYYTLFPTVAAAAAHCARPDAVVGAYSWHLKLVGFRCSQYNNDNGND